MVKFDARELTRRRTILWRHIDEEVRLRSTALKRGDKLRGRACVLRDVKRTRVLLDFGSLGEWWFPLGAVLLPGSIEPDPRQREFFA